MHEADQPKALLPQLILLSRNIRALLALRLAEIGLQLGEDEVLMSLGNDLPMSIESICKSLNISRSTLDRLLSRLDRKGLIKRVTDELVLLNALGEAEQLRISDVYRSIEDQVSGTTDAPGQAALGDHIDRLNSVISRQMI